MDETFLIHEHLFFDAEGLSLEGILSYRDDISSGQKVMLLSPHPHFAGDMNNNVIRAMANGLGESGRVVFRFNYHGGEESASPPLEDESIFDYWRRVEEDRDYERTIRDGLSAYQYLREVSPRNVTGCFVAGYSFGALIATLAAPQLEGLQGLLLVSPPFGKMDPARIQAPNCPVLILAGKKDFVFDETALNTASRVSPKFWASRTPRRNMLVISVLSEAICWRSRSSCSMRLSAFFWNDSSTSMIST